MIDLWLPPMPAIIRPHIEKASFLPGMFPAGAAAAVVGTFPQVQGTNNGGTSGFTTAASFNAPLPSGIQAGELLVLFVAAGPFGGGTADIIAPSGWTQLFHTANTDRFGCYYKVATGSEGATVAVSTTGNRSWATNSYRVSGYQGTPVAGTSATGATASPNPPSVSPSWGSAKTLWIACEADFSGANTAPSNPTN